MDRNSKILDEGCGSGGLLLSLHDLGFMDLMGVDPYVKENESNSIKILKKEILELPEDNHFDLIIFNHSFEHILRQNETLLKVSKILDDDGTCIISMPIKSNYVWSRYGTNWVQVDAPRHINIHNLESFDLLTRKAGFTVKKVIFDSTEFQFWGSEQYEKNIILRAANSYLIDPKNSIFTRKQIRKFRKMAED